MEKVLNRLVNLAMMFVLSFALPHLIWAETIKIPLQKLTASPSLELRCLHSAQDISIPLPERWKVSKAVLNLHYTASNNMVADLSQLVVKVNDQLVTQLKTNTMVPGVTHYIELPVRYLKAGYNTLSFEVTQHYARDNQCEQPCSPDLWTNINVQESSVEMDYELRPIPLRLGEANAWVFDPKQFPEATVNMIADTSTPEAVTTVAIAASGIARHFDYRKVKFTHSTDIKPDVDNVLIGSTAFVTQLLTRYGIRQESFEGGLLRVFYLPKSDGGKDGLHALIVVTGEKPAAIKVAAETFANMSLPYPGTENMFAHEFSMPDISMYSGRRELIADKLYDFKTLGLSSAKFVGYSGGYSEINFRLPPDFLIKQNQYAKLVLNLSYGSGMRQDSSLNLSLNGKTVRDIHLDSPNGNYIDGYKIEVPTHLFKPGTNIISFRPYLNTHRQACDSSNPDGMFVSLFDNSTLIFPPMPHNVEMPKLELFALNGFPFTRWPDGYETQIYLPKPDSGSIDSALNLIGMITQKNGFPLFGTQIVFSEPKNYKGELLVIGEAASIPKSIMSHAPLQPDGIANVDYPISRGWDSETSIAKSKQQGGLGEDLGLVMEFESPDIKGRTVVLVTAQTEKGLLQLSDALLSPGVQNSVNGDAALLKLNVPEYEVTSMLVGKRYTTGDKGETSGVDAFLYGNIYVLYGLIISAIILLSRIGYWLLRRYRRKRVTNGQV